MAIRVGINGYGRIGRNVVRALYESGRTDEIQIVAINDMGSARTNAHLTQYDTAHGRFPGKVIADEQTLVASNYTHHPTSSIIDAPLTKVLGSRLVKVCAWYDNEWGFANRMLDTAVVVMNSNQGVSC